MLTYLQIHKQGSELEYMNSFGKILIGNISVVHIEIDEWQKRVWYEIDNGDFVDGEIFRKI